MISLFILGNAIWWLMGENDALIWARQGADSYDKGIRKNEHVMLVAMRAAILLFGFVAGGVGAFTGTPILMAIVLLPLVFTYSFIHNGSYYMARNRIANEDGAALPYPAGFKANPSNTSTAKINLSWTARWRIASIGGMLYLISLILVL